MSLLIKMDELDLQKELNNLHMSPDLSDEQKILTDKKLFHVDM